MVPQQALFTKHLTWANDFDDQFLLGIGALHDLYAPVANQMQPEGWHAFVDDLFSAFVLNRLDPMQPLG
jgi:hypothetical protein